MVQYTNKVEAYLHNMRLIHRKYFSLEGGRIQLNKTDPNACGATIQHAKYSDSGTWNIVTFLCSRGRGKNQDNAIVVVERGIEIYSTA